MTNSGEPGEQLELAWPDDSGAWAHSVNKALFAWDEHQDLVYMDLGHVAPLPWTTPEMAAERMKALKGKLEVELRGSFVMSRKRAVELWDVLGKHLGLLQ